MVNRSDDFDFDTNDFDDFDFGDAGYDDGGQSKRGGREPISKLLGGFVRGAGDVLKNEDTQRTFIRDALPDGYVNVYDATLTTARGVKDLYNEAGNEVRKVNQETKKVVRKLLPHVKNTLPKSWVGKLDRYAGQDHKRDYRDIEGDEIASALSDIFGAGKAGYGVGANNPLTEEPIQSTKDVVDTTDRIVDQKLSLNMGNSLNRLLVLASKRDAYNDKVGIKLERKKVELGYKQLFAQTKMLQVQQQMLGLQTSAFKDIIQNTALPDIVKEHQSEKFHDMTRRAFYGKVADPLTKSMSGFVHKVVGKTKDKIKETASDFMSNMSMGSEAIELYFQMKELEREMDAMMNDGQQPSQDQQDRYAYLNQALEAAGNFGGSWAAQKGARHASKWIKNRFGDDERVKKYGLAGKNFVNNFDEYKRGFIGDLGGQNKLLGKFFEWIGMDYNESGQSMTLQESPLSNLRQRAIYTYKTERTINTVIPGLLSMIHNEIRILRTGDTSLEPLSYDFESDQFQSLKQRKDRIMQRVINEDDVKTARSSLDELTNVLETSTGKPLSGRAKKALSKYAVDNARQGQARFSLRDLVDSSSPIDDPDVAQEIREYIRDNIGIDESDVHQYEGSDVVRKAKADANASLKYQEIRDKLTGKMNDFTGRIPRDFSNALDVTKQEDLDILRELGLAHQGSSPGTWQYNASTLYNKILGINDDGLRGPQQPRNPQNLPIFGGASRDDPTVTAIKESNTKLAEIITIITGIQTKMSRIRRKPKPKPSDPAADQTTDQTEFDSGGYTGAGPKNEIAGNIHRGEIVFSKEDIARHGGVKAVNNFRLKGFASGGYTGDDGADQNTTTNRGFKNIFNELIEISRQNHKELLENLDNNFGELNEAVGAVSIIGLGGMQMPNAPGMLKKGWRKLKSGGSWLGSKAWSIGTSPIRGANNVKGWMWEGAKGLGKGIWGGITGGRDRLAGITDKIKDKAQDVFIQGRDKAVISLRDFKDRNLIDVNTGKIIEKIGDITGEVKDRAGNVILEAQEFASGLHILDKATGLPKLVSGGIKLAGRLLGGGFDLAKKAGGMPFKVVKGMWDTTKLIAGFMTRMGDIYVAGESRPRLIASLLNSGGYVLALTGKPIRSIKDITGEIKTLDGQTVLTYDDLLKGLYWANGKPVKLLADKIKSAMSGMWDKGKSILSAGWKMATMPARLVYGAGEWGVKKLLGLGKGGVEKASVTMKSSKTLSKIYELLDKRIPVPKKGTSFDSDGDGDRDGSALDRLQNAANQPHDEVKPKSEEAKEKPERKGILGILMTFLGAKFAKIGMFGTKVIGWLRKIFLINAAKGAGEALSGVDGGGGRGRGRGRGRLPTGGVGRFGKALAVGASIYGGYSMLNSDFGQGAMDSLTGNEPSPDEAAESQDPSLWDEYGGTATAIGGALGMDYLMNRRRGNDDDGPDVDPTTGARREPHGPPRQSRWSRFKEGAKRFGGKAKDVGKRWGGKALEYGGRGLNWARNAGSSLLSRQGLSTAGRFLGRQALWQGIRTAAVAGGSALGGLISAPVLIGAAAIAAVGVGAYLAYRYVNREQDYCTKFRMAQYGFKSSDEKSAEKLMQLEQMLLPMVSVDKTRPATLGKGVSVTDVAKLFGVDPQNKEDIVKLILWFNGRFKPVFLGCVTVYFKLTGNKDFQSADVKLKKDDKSKYLTDTHITDGGKNNPYLVAANPFAGEKTVKYMGEDVSDIYKDALSYVSKLKDADPAKDAKKQQPVKSGDQSYQDKQKENEKSYWQKAKEAMSSAYDSAVNWTSRRFEDIANASKTVGNTLSQAWQDTVGGGSTAAISGDRKSLMLSVHKAFMNAGLSDNQARIITAEVGRENSFDPKLIFGSHSDPANKKYNLGFLSWQGNRGKALYNLLASKGLISGDKMVQSQATLDYQAAYAVQEIKQYGEYKETRDKFLNNPNVTYGEGNRVLGTNFIRWRYNDQRYKSGHENRNKFYNSLNAALGMDAKQSTGPSATPANAGQVGTAATGGAPAKGGIPSTIAKPAATDTSGKALPPTIARPTTASTAGAMVSNASVAIQNSTTMAENTLDAKLIELGKQHTKKNDSGVDLTGMNQSFMKFFYCMVGEYFQKTGRGVLVTSAFRSVEKQRVLYNEYLARKKRPPAVAYPGNSKHNSGTAIDINSPDGNSLDSMGLLKKYRFHRPIPGEAWHLENLGFGKANATTANINKDLKTPAKQSAAATPAGSSNKVAPVAPPPAVASGKTASQVKADEAATAKKSLVDRIVASQNGTASAGATQTPPGGEPAANTPPPKPIEDTSARATAQRAAAISSNQAQEQKTSAKMQSATDAQLEATLGTNKRLDMIINLIKALDKSSSKNNDKQQAADKQPAQPQQPQSPFSQNTSSPSGLMAKDLTDPLDMARKNIA